jgi:hypothetical protein
MAGELTQTAPPQHVPGTPTEQDAHITKPPDHSTDDPVEPTSTDGGTTGGGTGGTSGGGGTGGTSGGGGSGGGSGGGGGGVNVPGTPVSIPPLPTTSIAPVDQTLTLAQATLQCTLDGLNQLLQPQAFQTCLDNYMNP